MGPPLIPLGTFASEQIRSIPYDPESPQTLEEAANHAAAKRLAGDLKDAYRELGSLNPRPGLPVVVEAAGASQKGGRRRVAAIFLPSRQEAIPLVFDPTLIEGQAKSATFDPELMNYPELARRLMSSIQKASGLRAGRDKNQAPLREQVYRLVLLRLNEQGKEKMTGKERTALAKQLAKEAVEILSGTAALEDMPEEHLVVEELLDWVRNEPLYHQVVQDWDNLKSGPRTLGQIRESAAAFTGVAVSLLSRTGTIRLDTEQRMSAQLGPSQSIAVNRAVYAALEEKLSQVNPQSIGLEILLSPESPLTPEQAILLGMLQTYSPYSAWDDLQAADIRYKRFARLDGPFPDWHWSPEIDGQVFKAALQKLGSWEDAINRLDMAPYLGTDTGGNLHLSPTALTDALEKLKSKERFTPLEFEILVQVAHISSHIALALAVDALCKIDSSLKEGELYFAPHAAPSLLIAWEIPEARLKLANLWELKQAERGWASLLNPQTWFRNAGSGSKVASKPEPGAVFTGRKAPPRKKSKRGGIESLLQPASFEKRGHSPELQNGFIEILEADGITARAAQVIPRGTSGFGYRPRVRAVAASARRLKSRSIRYRSQNSRTVSVRARAQRSLRAGFGLRARRGLGVTR